MTEREKLIQEYANIKAKHEKDEENLRKSNEISDNFQKDLNFVTSENK